MSNNKQKTDKMKKKMKQKQQKTLKRAFHRKNKPIQYPLQRATVVPT